MNYYKRSGKWKSWVMINFENLWFIKNGKTGLIQMADISPNVVVKTENN